jgi:predicted ferric reductase
MPYSLSRGVFWVSIFAMLAALPLALARVGAIPEARPFLVEFGVALGFVGLGLIALQSVFSGRFRRVAPSFGMDNVIQYHREMGIVGFGMVLAHVILLMAAEPSYLEFFDPRVNFLRSAFLILALLALVTLMVTSLWRETVGLDYEWWRLVHGGLALAVVFIGLVHAIQVSHYLEPLWKKVVLALLMAGSLYAVVHTRVVRPWLSRRRPYRVLQVRAERDASWSMELEPENHERLAFHPGQFAWLTIGDTPFTLQQHPFSIVSSARSPRIGFTAKELGDFTSSWKGIEPGARVFLEGPFGSFIPDPSPETGLFLVMGGIGITPGMCMLRTLRDDGDPRRVILIYGNQNWEDITFRDELEALERVMNLKVVHVLEDPHDGWAGESGFVTREMLDQYLPEQPQTFQYMVCGPGPLMDVTEIALRGLGISWDRIYTERFDIV